MPKGLGVPVKLLHESEGHIVTVELKTGETFRGNLVEAEDCWNMQMTNITHTSRDGRVTQMDKVFLRGSKIRFVIIPDMLKNAPMFKRLDPKKSGKAVALGLGRGRAAVLRAKARAAAAKSARR